VGLSVAEVHEAIETTPNVGRSRPGWPALLELWERDGVIEEYVSDIPLWPLEQWGALPHGLKSTAMLQEWWRYLRLAMRGGYYGLANVNFAGQEWQPTDHAVVLCGVREHWRDSTAVAGARSQVLEVLVSCSASCPEGRWEDARSLLRRGAFDAVLVRPREVRVAAVRT
jgi:hypothetical protein